MMPPSDNDHFYEHLPTHRDNLTGLFGNEQAFRSVPEDWVVIITDIKDSTRAVAKGLHETVNLVATGSIVTVLNALEKHNLSIPFFFGGDGATFLLPGQHAPLILELLHSFKDQVDRSLGVNLRVGMVPVHQLAGQGAAIQIAKFSYPGALCIPIVTGYGLQQAERLIKGEDALFSGGTETAAAIDLTGMHCRWDRIPAPKDKTEIVTLLVVAVSTGLQHHVFKKVLHFLDTNYGYLDSRRPITLSRLKVNATLTRLKLEIQARLGRISWTQIFHDWLLMCYSYIFFRTRKGKAYLKKLVELSDTLVIDGKINTVISGTASQREALERYLNELEQKGELLYGIHTSNASIMSCYVKDLEDGHIHFVDGAEGGYTQAARMLKAKLAGK